jgi:hypothetical protein
MISEISVHSPCPINSGPVVRQNIMVACGRGYSPHGRQEAERKTERSPGQNIVFKNMSPEDPLPLARSHLLKFSELPSLK